MKKRFFALIIGTLLITTSTIIIVFKSIGILHLIYGLDLMLGFVIGIGMGLLWLSIAGKL